MDSDEIKRITANAIIQAWLTNTKEGRAFFQSPYNWAVLHDGVRRLGELSVSNLSAAYQKLTFNGLYDLTKDAKPKKSIPFDAPAVGAPASAVTTPAAEPAEIPEHELPGYPARGGLEDGWRYQQRLTAWREQRAQQAFRDRENKRLAAQPPAQSTINRTKAEIKLRREANARHAARNPYQPE
ncbi:MAG: hypothetical protein WA197_19170 [Candidatus Acidiferrales bacterium]